MTPIGRIAISVLVGALICNAFVSPFWGIIVGVAAAFVVYGATKHGY